MTDTAPTAPTAYQEGLRVIVGAILVVLLLVAAGSVGYLLYYPRGIDTLRPATRVAPLTPAAEDTPPLALLPLGVEQPKAVQPPAPREKASPKAPPKKKRRPDVVRPLPVEVSGG